MTQPPPLPDVTARVPDSPRPADATRPTAFFDVLWPCLCSVALSVAAYILLRLSGFLAEEAPLVAASELFWELMVAGVVCAVLAWVLGVLGFVRGRRREGRHWPALLAVIAAAGAAIWALLATVRAVWNAVLIMLVLLGIIAATTPQGMMVLAGVYMLSEGVREAMLSSQAPEWRMVHVEYMGVDLPDAPGKARFRLTNTGQLPIERLRGKIHVFGQHHVEIPAELAPTRPLGPSESVSLDLPLEGAVATAVEEIKTARAESDRSGRDEATDGRRLPLRFQVSSFVGMGRRHVPWFDEMVIADKQAFFETMRDFTSPEWRLIDVDYVEPAPDAEPGPATFQLTNRGEQTITSLKGKFHVMDICDGHVQRDVRITSPTPLAPGESFTWSLPSGPESDLASRIITQARAYESAAGQEDQSTYILRLQLQEFETVGGEAYFIWFGDIKRR